MKNAILTTLAAALLGGAACAPLDSSDATFLAATTGALTFEEWSATLEKNDRGDFMVEGDLAIAPADLRRYFDEELPAPNALSVSTTSGVEKRWGTISKYDLTYCIDDSFGTDKQAVADAIDAAARAWEQVAEVRFVYVSSEDGADCDASNTNVIFNVRRGDCGSSCQASSFFPGDSRSARELLVDTYFWAPLLTSPYTQTGIMTHELGHVLGFRHEHIWTACTTEGENSDGRGANHLTPTDTASVMFYTWCTGATNNTTGYRITELDALGAACKYNASIPRSACDQNRNGANDSQWRSNGSARTWSGTNFNVGGIYHPIAGDFDGNGKDDVLWYGRGNRADFIWWANATGSFDVASTEISGLYEPVAGDFDGDGRSDILWYGGKSRADYLWFGNTNRTFTSVNITLSGEYLPKAGDFDGDGRDDVLLYAAGSGADYILWANTNRTFSTASISVGGSYEVFVLDQNGDGKDDIFWYEPGTTIDPLWRGSSTRTFTTVNYGVDGSYTPVAGNFDGTSGDDIIWYGAGSGADSIWYSNGALTPSSVSMTISGYQVPIAGDFDGDGDTDLLWYSPL